MDSVWGESVLHEALPSRQTTGVPQLVESRRENKCSCTPHCSPNAKLRSTTRATNRGTVSSFGNTIGLAGILYPISLEYNGCSSVVCVAYLSTGVEVADRAICVAFIYISFWGEVWSHLNLESLGKCRDYRYRSNRRIA